MASELPQFKTMAQILKEDPGQALKDAEHYVLIVGKGKEKDDEKEKIDKNEKEKIDHEQLFFVNASAPPDSRSE